MTVNSTKLLLMCAPNRMSHVLQKSGPIIRSQTTGCDEVKSRICLILINNSLYTTEVLSTINNMIYDYCRDNISMQLKTYEYNIYIQMIHNHRYFRSHVP